MFQGYFMRPTVVTGVTDTSRLITEEIFGPVVCVLPFDTLEEVSRVLQVEDLPLNLFELLYIAGAYN